MRLPNFTVYCSDPDHRQEPARYKVAAEWTGGGSREWKTFGFANDACVQQVLQAARHRIAKVHFAEGETLGPLIVFKLDPSKHDYELERVDIPA